MFAIICRIGYGATPYQHNKVGDYAYRFEYIITSQSKDRKVGYQWRHWLALARWRYNAVSSFVAIGQQYKVVTPVCCYTTRAWSLAASMSYIVVLMSARHGHGGGYGLSRRETSSAEYADVDTSVARQ